MKLIGKRRELYLYNLIIDHDTTALVRHAAFNHAFYKDPAEVFWKNIYDLYDVLSVTYVHLYVHHTHVQISNA